MKCNCNNSEFAYILNNIDDNLNDTISIINFINNKDLQKEIKLGNKFLVCKEKQQLIKYESQKIKNHFKHKVYKGMTEWHKNLQNNFEHLEIPFGNKIADVVIDDLIIVIVVFIFIVFVIVFTVVVIVVLS